tara:strand:- start:540 stop:944 length:405 start_codon:yes stop_codon:yes gene_type:complete
MSNHYHLLIETNAATFSKWMKYLNGVNAQKYNRCHQLVGYVFQGCFKAILVEKELYLLELARLIVLNAVRAIRVRAAKGWPWSSYRATTELSKSHECSPLTGFYPDLVIVAKKPASSVVILLSKAKTNLHHGES